MPRRYRVRGRVVQAPLPLAMCTGGGAWSASRSGCSGEAVATHHCCDRCDVGRPAPGSVEDSCNLAEEVRAENAGGNDRQRLGVHIAGVVEVVDSAAWDQKRLAGANLGRRSLDRPGQHPVEAVDRLLVAFVAVRDRHPRAGRHIRLEDRDRSSRLLALNEEPDRYLPYLDLCRRACCHRSSSSRWSETELTVHDSHPPTCGPLAGHSIAAVPPAFGGVTDTTSCLRLDDAAPGGVTPHL